MKYTQYINHPLVGSATQSDFTNVKEKDLHKKIASYIFAGWEAKASHMRTDSWDEYIFRKDRWVVTLVIDWERKEEED